MRRSINRIHIPNIRTGIHGSGVWKLFLTNLPLNHKQRNNLGHCKPKLGFIHSIQYSMIEHAQLDKGLDSHRYLQGHHNSNIQ